MKNSGGASHDSIENLDVVIIGAGFAGLYMLHRLLNLGLSVRIFEAGSGVGGTWYWNRYPGARCDIESMEYSYQFSDELQQDWVWTERYAAQPEILRYIEHVTDRFNLRGHIQFNTRVERMQYNESQNFWKIETDCGDSISAKFSIMATGCLSVANFPNIKGIDRFKGQIIHTGLWPKNHVNLIGRRIGIIGTGSSAVQAIPLIAKEATHLYVFQRTPTYSIPAHNVPLDPVKQKKIKSDYKAFRLRNSQTVSGIGISKNPKSAFDVSIQERNAQYEARWREGGFNFGGSFSDISLNLDANKTAVEFICHKIREIVKDPKIADMLCPNHTFGCKRNCVDSGYYETFNRSNVTLVDQSVSHISENAVMVNHKSYDIDMLIFATGYDAMTGALMKVDIRGRNDMKLSSKWIDGPKNYLGLAIHGFPNFFTITGPGSPSVLSNMVSSIEQHVNWISDCIEYLYKAKLLSIEAEKEAEDQWLDHVNKVASQTLYFGCNSWYLGANIKGKPRVFMPYIGVPAYKKKCDQVAAEGYEGFLCK